MTRIGGLLAGVLWLTVGLVLCAILQGVVQAGDYPSSPLVVDLSAPGLVCTTYRSVAADLAVLLAPRAVRRHTRAVVLCESGLGAIVWALDRHGKVLCAQSGRRRDLRMQWGAAGVACGW